MATVELTLGSTSPRRRDLLEQIGVKVDRISPADIDESPLANELPRVYVERISREKNSAIEASGLVLTADTIVSAGRRILGKPADASEAAQFLMILSGRRHKVTTSICLRLDETVRQRTVETRVTMKRLSDHEISAYLRSGEWQGKAGGYAIQGIGAALIPEINGSYSNVVGLPLTETANLLQGMGYPVTLDGSPA